MVAMQFSKPTADPLPSGNWFFEQPVASGNQAEVAGTVDVCIIGGGFTGLWTAIWLKTLAPETSVHLLEAETCGAGASARSGGFAVPWHVKAASLEQNFGREAAQEMVAQSSDALKRIREFCAQHAPQAHFKRTGWVQAFVEEKQFEAIGPLMQVLSEWQAEGVDCIDAPEASALSGYPNAAGGFRDASACTLRPSALVHAMQQRAITLGVRVSQNSAVTKLYRKGATAPRFMLETKKGNIGCENVVLALNAWAHGLPTFRRTLLPIAVDAIVLNGPGVAALREETPAVSISRMQPVFYQTASHDITGETLVLGQAGRAVPFAGSIGKNLVGNSPVSLELFEKVRRMMPALEDTELQSAWSGPIARSWNASPSVGEVINQDGIFYAHGYAGAGIIGSELMSRVLASKMLGINDAFSRLPLVNSHKNYLPLEPIRYLATRLVRHAATRVDMAIERKTEPSWITRFIASQAYK